jgi:DNA mismatch repair protein MutL
MLRAVAPGAPRIDPVMQGEQRRGPRIRELPEVVRNQIAAGEVVERPASALKELVENAIDAGARHLRIDLEQGGVRLIRVTDDGSGLEPQDLALAFTAHATSKLHELADLDHIGSLGFRGEALASIGAVSRARILSRVPGASTGAEVRNDGGRIEGPREAGAPPGTTVEVRDLFYNTPARRRFLKSTATELGRCLDVLQRLTLAQLGVGFVATHDGRRLLDVSAEMDLRDRVRRLFGAELADSLVAVQAAGGATELNGLVAPPRFARRDQSRQMWFLNGRPLRDKLLTRVLKEGYRGFLEEGRQPAAFLALSVPPERVDVNVHPMKSEVRFRDERPLFGFLVSALRAAPGRAPRAPTQDRPGCRAAPLRPKRASRRPSCSRRVRHPFRPARREPRPGREPWPWPKVPSGRTARPRSIPAGRRWTTSAVRTCRSTAPTSCAPWPTGSRSSTNTRCTSD